MTILKTLLGFLSVFSVVTKWLPSIGAISGLFGPVGPMIAAVLTFLVNVVKWFFEGLTAMLSNPVTFITAGVFMACAFLGGVKFSKEKYEAALARKELVITTMIEDGKKADAENKLQFEKALVAKKAAEEGVKSVPTTDVTPATDKPAPVVKRVRSPEGKGLNQVGGPSLQWFGEVFK